MAELEERDHSKDLSIGDRNTRIDKDLKAIESKGLDCLYFLGIGHLTESSKHVNEPSGS